VTAAAWRASWWVLALALAAAILPGCGRKGPVVAPERRLPVPAADLRAHIDEESVVVRWTNPKTRADGSSLRDLRTVRLFRRE